MSTAIAVSAFYDVDFCSNRRSVPQGHRSAMLNSDHKAVGTPITGANRNRNILERSISEPADRNANAQVMQQQGNRNNVNSSRYKTELCRPFEENGYCKYGDKCQFAHGPHELRSLARHPKYKTELCRTFHTIGFCPYGPRCHFIHNEDERKLSQIDHLKQPQDGPHQQQQQQPPSVPAPAQAPAISEAGPRHMPQLGRLSPPQHQHRPARFPLSLPIVARDSLGSAADSPTSSVTDSPVMSPTFMGDNELLSSSLSRALTGPLSTSAAPMSAPVTSHQFRNAFNFVDPSVQHAPTLMSPLNIHTTDPIASLSADLQAAALSQQQQQNQRNNNSLLNSLQHPQHPVSLFGLSSLASLSDENLYAPPSPPDSLSGDSSSSSSSSSSGSSSSSLASSSSSMSTSSVCGSPQEISRAVRLPIFTTLSNE